MNMPKYGIITSALLILIGVVGYVISLTGEKASWTALIPAICGVTILLSSLLAKKNLKLGMHLAAVFGLVTLAGGIREVTKLEAFSFEPSVLAKVAMTIVAAVFVGLCVKSFIDVRRARAKEQG